MAKSLQTLPRSTSTRFCNKEAGGSFATTLNNLFLNRHNLDSVKNRDPLQYRIKRVQFRRKSRPDANQRTSRRNFKLQGLRRDCPTLLRTPLSPSPSSDLPTLA